MQSIISQQWLRRFLPFLEWKSKVNREVMRIDFMAGVTGAVVVLPQGVAFAVIAGMPPEYGLYAAMIPAIIAALFGSSWHLVSGPTTAASIVLFSTLSALAEPGSAMYVKMALTLTMMVGLIELFMGFAKLGALVNFISHSVVIGFTAGAAILIASSQLKNFFGVAIPRGLHVHEIIGELFSRGSEINLSITAVALLTMFSGIAVKKLWPKMPYMIVAMLVGGVAAAILNAILGSEVTKISMVGALPNTLPPLSSPSFEWEHIKDLAPAALAVTLFALTEAVSIARSLAVRSGQHLNGNQEFVGQGLSNIIGSFFSAYVATGSFNRSGVNYDAGARTPLAAMFAGALLLMIVPLVAGLAVYLPYAAMAGILMLVAWGLIDFHHISKILKASRQESAVLIITFFATLLLELEFAILLGVMSSLVVYLLKTSRPNIYSRVPDPSTEKRKFTTSNELSECPQLKIIRIDGSIFFGAVSYIADLLNRYRKRKPEQNHMIIVGKGVNFVDVAGSEYLVQLSEQKREEGGGLYFIDLKEGVKDPLKKGGYLDEIGEDNVFRGKSEALATIYKKLDKKICETCPHRIFRECVEEFGAPSAGSDDKK